MYLIFTPQGATEETEVHANMRRRNSGTEISRRTEGFTATNATKVKSINRLQGEQALPAATDPRGGVLMS